MKTLPLPPHEAGLIVEVFRGHPEVDEVRIFGSRAKGTHSPRSDVDLALWGNVSRLDAEAIAAELDDLPLPYRFDVVVFEMINLRPLREHIGRVGIRLYPEGVIGRDGEI